MSRDVAEWLASFALRAICRAPGHDRETLNLSLCIIR